PRSTIKTAPAPGISATKRRQNVIKLNRLTKLGGIVVRRIAPLLLVAMLLTACGGASKPAAPAPAKLEVTEFVFDLEDPVAPNVRGWVKNTGGAAPYVELAVKLTPPNDPDTIY